jgi:hypothetical protein
MRRNIALSQYKCRLRPRLSDHLYQYEGFFFSSLFYHHQRLPVPFMMSTADTGASDSVELTDPQVEILRQLERLLSLAPDEVMINVQTLPEVCRRLFISLVWILPWSINRRSSVPEYGTYVIGRRRLPGISQPQYWNSANQAHRNL